MIFGLNSCMFWTKYFIKKFLPYSHECPKNIPKNDCKYDTTTRITYYGTCLKVGDLMKTWHHEAEAHESLVQEKRQKYAKLSRER